jgi:DNA-binding NarL/FixJ family response regulator
MPWVYHSGPTLSGGRVIAIEDRGSWPHAASTRQTATRLRVLVCDTHEVFQIGLYTVLRSVPDLVVVGQAASAVRAIELSMRVPPHVALVSRELKNGFLPVVRVLSRRGIGVVVLSHGCGGPGIADAFAAGASDYLPESVTPERLIDVVRTVAAGTTNRHPDAPAGHLVRG